MCSQAPVQDPISSAIRRLLDDLRRDGALESMRRYEVRGTLGALLLREAFDPEVIEEALTRGFGPAFDPSDFSVEPLREPLLYRVRIELCESEPLIWREVLVRSDATLDDFHLVIQEVFGWWNYHLYQFTLPASGDRSVPVDFLCPFTFEEDDFPGLPATGFRVDQVFRDLGDRVEYLYDFGDNWDFTATLTGASPLPVDQPFATCVGGARATPPEDCGGVRTLDQLAHLLEDPAHWDIGAANQRLDSTVNAPRTLDLIRYVYRSEVPTKTGALLANLPVYEEAVRACGYSPLGLLLIEGVRAEPSPATDDQAGSDLERIIAFLRTIGEADTYPKLTALGPLTLQRTFLLLRPGRWRQQRSDLPRNARADEPNAPPVD